MKPIHPADELAEVRSELARLRLREMQLRQVMLNGPADVRRGRWFQVEMHEVTTKKLDPGKLPAAILRDETLYSASLRLVLHCRAHLLSSAHLQGPMFPSQGRLQ